MAEAMVVLMVSSLAETWVVMLDDLLDEVEDILSVAKLVA
jgi:hypothetical protein